METVVYESVKHIYETPTAHPALKNENLKATLPTQELHPGCLAGSPEPCGLAGKADEAWRVTGDRSAVSTHPERDFTTLPHTPFLACTGDSKCLRACCVLPSAASSKVLAQEERLKPRVRVKGTVSALPLLGSRFLSKPHSRTHKAGEMALTFTLCLRWQLHGL